jgi:hypothetical protein
VESGQREAVVAAAATIPAPSSDHFRVINQFVAPVTVKMAEIVPYGPFSGLGTFLPQLISISATIEQSSHPRVEAHGQGKRQ